MVVRNFALLDDRLLMRAPAPRAPVEIDVVAQRGAASGCSMRGA
jgi:hypothetical protein